MYSCIHICTHTYIHTYIHVLTNTYTVYVYHRYLLNILMYIIMPCVALLVYCLQTTIVVVYCVSLLVFILLLAPGFIHIVTDLCYVVTIDDSTDFNDDFNDSYKDNFAKNSVLPKINIILTTAVLLYTLLPVVFGAAFMAFACFRCTQSSCGGVYLRCAHRN